MSKYGKLDIAIEPSSEIENDIGNECNVQSPRVVRPTKRCNFCFVFSLFISIAGILTLIAVPTYEHFQQTNTTLPNPSSLSARVWPHSHDPHYYQHYHCSDGGYDCCYIYSTHIYQISPRKAVGRDEVGSNCPSLVTLINNYNKYIDDYFTPKNCSEVECCTIDASRDLSIRYNKTFTNRLYEINEEICPTISQIIHRYELGYPDPKNELIVIVVIFSCFMCAIACSR